MPAKPQSSSASPQKTAVAPPLSRVRDVSVSDILQSAFTLAENTQYGVIRARHQLGCDAAYRSDLARTLVAAATVCAELVGTAGHEREPVTGLSPHAPERAESIESLVLRTADWYREHMQPSLADAMHQTRS